MLPSPESPDGSDDGDGSGDEGSPTAIVAAGAGLPDNDVAVAVNQGGHQVRLYRHYPATAGDVAMVVTGKKEDAFGMEIPCATITLRLLVPPKRGNAVLTTDTLPVSEWESAGLVQPKPEYTDRG